ncbi:hypothetical protein [Pseudomonas laurentiana]
MASMESDYGKNSDAYKFVSGMRESMSAALVKKEDWLRQPDTSALNQDRFKDSKPKTFKGQLLLVTDSFCASACLDFADAVLAAPGTIHFGLSTSGGTLYIDLVTFEVNCRDEAAGPTRAPPTPPASLR